MRKRKFTTLLVAAITILSGIQASAFQSDNVSPKLRVDTIFRVDTVETKEVIQRTEVIHRTEKVVRYYENGRMIEKNLETGDTVRTLPLPAGAYPVIVNNIQPGSGEEKITENVSETPSGGKYLWIPDSMAWKVDKLLTEGTIATQASVNLEEKPVDLYEKVIFRGDTINMVLKDRNLGRYDRGLFNYLFIPKGIWQIGMTASYGEFSTDNLQILDLVSDIDFSGKLWAVRPYFQYFFKSNLSLGVRLGFTQGLAKIGSFKVDIDEDMNFNLHDIMYKSNSYSAAFTFSQYLGIARRGRFGVFNEVELAFAGGDSDFNRPYNGEMRKTHTNTFQASLNFSPGVCVYVLDQVSFNVSLGVFGLNIKHEKQKVNGEDLGSRTTSGANFRFNIFNINFGIAVSL